MKKIAPFNGFYKETFKFFSDLEKNNNSDWFYANRDNYQNNLVEPARSFVVSMGQFFNHLNPSIRTEPKFNKTLMRISKDMRFAKGDPYKNYFLIHFGRFKMDSEFFVYLDKNGIDYGIFLNNDKHDDLYFNLNLEKNKKEIVETFKKFKINNNFDLHNLSKEPELAASKFNANKNFQVLSGFKHILFQKNLSKKEKIIYSPDFITEMIKTFSKLYPLYCFAISPNPLKLIDDFEERMGTAI